METTFAGWTPPEVAVAQAAFDRAYDRAITTLIDSLRLRVADLESVDSVWQLHDYLSIQRHGIEGRFDFRLDGILFVFASLVKEGLLELVELEGLDEEKLGKIAAMARF